MRKLIDINDEEVGKLKIEAVKQGKSFKSYLEDKILINEHNDKVDYLFEKENSFATLLSIDVEKQTKTDLVKIMLSETQEGRGVVSHLIDCYHIVYKDVHSTDKKHDEELIVFLEYIVDEINCLLPGLKENILDYNYEQIP